MAPMRCKFGPKGFCMTGAPFLHRRRVGFGDCDSSRVFFAPRAFDYAVEAVEAWYDAVLGGSWSDLVTRHGLEVRIYSAQCAYLRPLVAGQVLLLRIDVVDVGHNSFTLSVVGD